MNRPPGPQAASERGPWRYLAGLLAVLLSLANTARAVELISGPELEVVSPTNAIIRWSTDVSCGTRVQFGTLSNRLDRRAEGVVSTNHVVTLSALKPDVRYVYTIGTARYALATNAFQTPPASASPSTNQAAKPNVNPAPAKPTWVAPPAPPARETWGSLSSLPDHFDRHGKDFKARSAEDYAAMAWQFLQRAKAEGLPMKRDDEGVLRVFDPKTRAFAAYNRDGTTKTFFKPQSRDYFERQPGKPVKPKDLP